MLAIALVVSNGAGPRFVTTLSIILIQGQTKPHFLIPLSQNPGYYDIMAEDMSVWHVPNRAQLQTWRITSILRYHTEAKFLAQYGGNLHGLFKVQNTTQDLHWGGRARANDWSGICGLVFALF